MSNKTIRERHINWEINRNRGTPIHIQPPISLKMLKALLLLSFDNLRSDTAELPNGSNLLSPLPWIGFFQFRSHVHRKTDHVTDAQHVREIVEVFARAGTTTARSACTCTIGVLFVNLNNNTPCHYTTQNTFVNELVVLISAETKFTDSFCSFQSSCISFNDVPPYFV